MGFARPRSLLVLLPALLILPIGCAVEEESNAIRSATLENDVDPNEATYNPFGDPWASAGAPNAWISVARTPGCHRRGSLLGRTSVSPQEVEFLAGSSSVIVFEECATIPANPNPRLRALADALRARDSRVKYVGYIAPTLLLGDQAGFPDVVLQHPEWVLKGTDGAPLRWPQPDGNGPPVLDATNPYYRQLVAQRIAEGVHAHAMGGVMLDFIKRDLPPELLAALPEGMGHIWMLSMIDLVRDIKAALGPDSIVLVNRPLEELEYTQALLTYVDGVLLEDPLGRFDTDIIASGRHQKLTDMLNLTESLQKHALIVVNTNINGTAFATTDSGLEHAFAKLYVSAFLQYFRSARTSIVYYTPTYTSPQFDASTHFDELDMNIGPAIEPSAEIAPHVFHRKFQNAYTYWNNSPNPYEVEFGECCTLVNLDGQRVARQTIPPWSGMIFGGDEMFR